MARYGDACEAKDCDGYLTVTKSEPMKTTNLRVRTFSCKVCGWAPADNKSAVSLDHAPVRRPKPRDSKKQAFLRQVSRRVGRQINEGSLRFAIEKKRLKHPPQTNKRGDVVYSSQLLEEFVRYVETQGLSVSRPCRYQVRLNGNSNR